MTQLQKLLFIAYGAYLAKHNDEPLINEQPKAWPFGSIFSNVRKKVSSHKIIHNNPIFDQISGDKEVVELLDKVIDNYSSYSAKQLSDCTHAVDSPWHKTISESPDKWNTVIPANYIVEYFSGLEI